jgi:3-phosphoshikimate 1-carboxyvinyltransferase
LFFTRNVSLTPKKIFRQCILLTLNFLNTLNNSITLRKRESLYGIAKTLPASKSISNRVLIMNALGGNQSILHNLSDANDTRLMEALVNSEDDTIDVEDAGTTMRFLTAFFSITNKKKNITCASRMKERPIGILVNALRTLGADIQYLEKEGYPPLSIQGFKGQSVDQVRIRGDVSSQFISALMMVAPSLPKGLTLELEGKVGSRPYIEMTQSLMKHFGIDSKFLGNTIHVPCQKYKPATFTVESDWSGASYWFAFAALAAKAEIQLPRLHSNSLQGDSAIIEIMKRLGVQAEMKNGHLILTKIPNHSSIECDFTHCPDLAQTVAVVCAAKGIEGKFSGLESLRIKETDRITALQNEVRKIGADFVEDQHSIWNVVPSKSLPEKAFFNTYKDHRMAMAFAPLATLFEVEIENPSVVRKSYPTFWDDVRGFGFDINQG